MYHYEILHKNNLSIKKKLQIQLKQISRSIISSNWFSRIISLCFVRKQYR